MKFFKVAAILIFLLGFYISGFTYTRIYLFSETETGKENLVLSDICKMEGDGIDKIAGIVISSGLYKDGIVDSQELYDLLSKSLGNKLLIFGSGVKIRKIKTMNGPEVMKTILVEKGEMVDLSIKKNGIVIEIKGKALSSGSEKDKIDFRLSTGKVIKGKIISLNRADIDL